jgi:predicted transcriptional regulator
MEACVARNRTGGTKAHPISIRLDADVRSAIEALAKEDERSLSSYVNRALRQHVEAMRKQRKDKG